MESREEYANYRKRVDSIYTVIDLTPIAEIFKGRVVGKGLEASMVFKRGDGSTGIVCWNARNGWNIVAGQEVIKLDTTNYINQVLEWFREGHQPV